MDQSRKVLLKFNNYKIIKKIYEIGDQLLWI